MKVRDIKYAEIWAATYGASYALQSHQSTLTGHGPGSPSATRRWAEEAAAVADSAVGRVRAVTARER